MTDSTSLLSSCTLCNSASIDRIEDPQVCVQVASITPAIARLLHAAGIRDPELLAAAPESRVAEALAAGQRRRRLEGAAAALAVGMTGAVGTNVLVTRQARQLIAGTFLLQLINSACWLSYWG